MKAAFLFSIAVNFFLIEFLNTPTRIDGFLADPVLKVWTTMVGDLVLLSGAAIVAGLVIGIVKAVKK